MSVTASTNLTNLDCVSEFMQKDIQKSRISTDTLKKKLQPKKIKMLLTISVPKSMQRMVTVPSGRGISQRIKARKGEISGMFEVKV